MPKEESTRLQERRKKSATASLEVVSERARRLAERAQKVAATLSEDISSGLQKNKLSLEKLASNILKDYRELLSSYGQKAVDRITAELTSSDTKQIVTGIAQLLGIPVDRFTSINNLVSEILLYKNTNLTVPFGAYTDITSKLKNAILKGTASFQVQVEEILEFRKRAEEARAAMLTSEAPGACGPAAKAGSAADCYKPQLQKFKTKKVCDSPYNLERMYLGDRTLLSGGKSGAFIFKIKNREGVDRILKYYPQNEDDRPYRDIVSLCTMSGVPGFPCAYEFGCALCPRSWHHDLANPRAIPDVGLFIEMSFSAGETLSSLNLDILNPEDVLTIAWKLLGLLQALSANLGGNVEHYDFHPDNIFVQIKPSECQEVTVRTTKHVQTVSCPNISVIDFDLLSSNTLNAMEGFSHERLREHTSKKIGLVSIPERTLSFVISTMGLSNAVAFIAIVKSMDNTDLRNWYVIVVSLLHRAGFKNLLNECSTVETCVDALTHYKSKEFTNNPDEMFAPAANTATRSSTYLNLARHLLTLWDPYNKGVVEYERRENKNLVYPNFDTTVFAVKLALAYYVGVQLQKHIYTAVRLRWKSTDMYMPPETQVFIQTKQLIPRISVVFNGQNEAAPPGHPGLVLVFSLRSGIDAAILKFKEINISSINKIIDEIDFSNIEGEGDSRSRWSEFGKTYIEVRTVDIAPATDGENLKVQIAFKLDTNPALSALIYALAGKLNISRDGDLYTITLLIPLKGEGACDAGLGTEKCAMYILDVLKILTKLLFKIKNLAAANNRDMVRKICLDGDVNFHYVPPYMRKDVNVFKVPAIAIPEVLAHTAAYTSGDEFWTNFNAIKNNLIKLDKSWKAVQELLYLRSPIEWLLLMVEEINPWGLGALAAGWRERTRYVEEHGAAKAGGRRTIVRRQVKPPRSKTKSKSPKRRTYTSRRR
jgi:hypothetical protein